MSCPASDTWNYTGERIPDEENTTSLGFVLRQCLSQLPFQNPSIRVFTCIYGDCPGNHVHCFRNPQRRRVRHLYHLYQETTTLSSDNLQGRMPWFTHECGLFSLLCGERNCYDISTPVSLRAACNDVFPSYIPTDEQQRAASGKFLFGFDFKAKDNRRHVIVAIEVVDIQRCETCAKPTKCPRSHQTVQELLGQIHSNVQADLERYEKTIKSKATPNRGKLTSGTCPL